MHQSLTPWRVGPQLLDEDPGRAVAPRDVVHHLGAVQSQEHLMAPWTVGRRCGATMTQVLDGLWPQVVRTHALRTTWHYVDLDDLPTIVSATSDRVRRQVVAHVGRQGLAESDLDAAGQVVAEAVREQPGCDRGHLAARLADGGTPLAGDQLAHAVMIAELEGSIAGERRPGGQHVYHPITLGPLPPTDEARVLLARAYARGHGPVSDRDLAWWSSLTLTQARQALRDADLRPVTLAGRDLWSLGTPAERDVPTALLLPNFDELISYQRDAPLRDEVGAHYDAIMFSTGLLLLDGRLAGHWTRRVATDRVEVDVRPVTALTARQHDALEDEVQGFGRFLERPVKLAVTPLD